MTDTVHEQYTFLIICRSVLLIIRNISDKLCRERQNTHFMFNNFFFLNRAVYEIMWKNIVQPDRSQTMRTRIAWWMIKATNTHSAYVILIALLPPQWLHKHKSMLRYTYSRSYTGLHIMYRYSCQIFTKRDPSRHIFLIYSNIKFHEIPFGGSRVVPDRQTDMMQLIVAFRSFANAPTNSSLCTLLPFLCYSLYTYIHIANGDPRVTKWQLTDSDKLLVYFFHRLVQVPHLLTTGTTSVLTP